MEHSNEYVADTSHHRGKSGPTDKFRGGYLHFILLHHRLLFVIHGFASFLNESDSGQGLISGSSVYSGSLCLIATNGRSKPRTFLPSVKLHVTAWVCASIRGYE